MKKARWLKPILKINRSDQWCCHFTQREKITWTLLCDKKALSKTTENVKEFQIRQTKIDTLKLNMWAKPKLNLEQIEKNWKKDNDFI
jgi:hypothetical protein